MAINQNHLFEDLEGVKCAVVEKNVSPARVEFLRSILELNSFKVIVVPSPPAKGVVVPEGEVPPPSTSFTVGVTDVRFNATNAIFGRLLKTKDGHFVTLAYWQQKESVSDDSKPYFQK
jgi:hypothetical protein